MNSCPYVYDPRGQRNTFIVYFDEINNEPAQHKRAERVIAHLLALNDDELEEESIQFFKWLVLYPLSSLNECYAAKLLAFFHSKGKLLLRVEASAGVEERSTKFNLK